MKIMGIDLSLRATGIVIRDTDDLPDPLNLFLQWLIKSSPTTDQKMIDRLCEIRNKVVDVIEVKKPDKIVIEGLSYGSKNTSSLCDLAKLNFAIEVYCKHMGIPYEMVPPTTLKKFVTGKGNCKKDLMLMKVFKRWGVEFEDDNLCDAFALCKYGEAKING
jgi:crossover junction endodeoxyribonuclease RuvC